MSTPPAVTPPVFSAAALPVPSEDTVRTAGRGGAAVAGAKLFFLAVGLLQQILLPRVLGIEGYGALSRVLALVNVTNNVVIASGMQGGSRFVAEAKGQDGVVAREITILHLSLATFGTLLFYGLAPVVATATGAPHLKTHLSIASIIFFAYCLYGPLIGVLNGRRRFGTQAGLDVVYAILRTIGLLGGGWLFSRYGVGPMGAVGGFALASILVLPLAAWATRIFSLASDPVLRIRPRKTVAERLAIYREKGIPTLNVRAYVTFLLPLAVGQLFLNLLMQVDITLLGRFATDTALHTGLSGPAATAAADRSVAIYRACQLFSFLPYQILFSITFILFPLLAKAHSDGDRDAVARYVKTGLRLACLLAGGMVAITFGLASNLLHLVFLPDIADHGGRALRLLALGQGAFALFGIQTTILSSLRRERWTMILNAVATAIVIGFAYLLVPGSSVGAAMAERSALATSLALALALIAGGIAVWRVAGALISPWSMLRISGAFVTAAFVGTRLPPTGRLATIVFAVAVGVVYLVCLTITGELGKQDLALIRRVIARRKPGA